MLLRCVSRAAFAALVVPLFLAVPLRAGEPEAIARKLYERVAEGDLDGLHALLAEGVSIPPRLALFPRVEAVRCVSLSELRVGDVRHIGDRVEVPVTAGFAKLDPVTGRQPVDVEHALLGMKPAGNGWKLDSWTFEEDLLADRLLNAPSDAAADDLLATSPELWDALLTLTLRLNGTSFVNRREAGKARRMAASLHTLAAFAADDDMLANAYVLDSMITRIVGQEQIDRGVEVSEAALAAARRGGNPDTIATALVNLSRAFQWKVGNTSRGVPLLEEALALRSRLLDENIAERAAIQIVVYHMERGDYRSCFPYLTIARDISLRTNDAFGRYSVETALGELFNQENDCALAILHYRRALDLARSIGFVGGTITNAQHVAHCSMLLGDEVGFRATTEEVFKTGKNLDKSTASSMWADVAVHHLRRKELDQADDAGKKVMELADGAVEDDAKAGARDLLARIRFEQKRYREAVEAAEGAIAFWTKRGDVNQLSAWVLAAKAHLALGEREAAYKALREGVRCGELARASAGGTERQVALLFEPAAEAYSMLVDLLVEDHQPREALLVAENAKARTLLDILDGVRSTAESDAPAAMLREERRLEKQLVAANVGGAPSAITRARLELETYRSIVDADRPQLHAARGAGDLRSVDALAPLLPGPRAALVEFVICEKRLHIFIVRRGRGAPRVDVRTIRIARKTLEQLATRHADALAQYSLAYESGARRLYEILLAPVVRVAPQARDLCIIPDGALWRVPFESLLDGHGAFAVESRAFFYAPSAAVLLREHAHEARPGRKDHQFLGFGDPLLEVSPRETLTTRERGAGRAPIPEAAREVETIARIIGPQASTVFTGANALESRLKAEARDFRIVHLATHGVIDDANPMYSHLLLARHEGDGEDGVLEAREMLGLSLQADLVVLSACDTARGGVHDGEGLIGMSWALFAAGSPSVIASQWRVDSARTETLMTAFYRVWMNEPHTAFAKAHALRTARLALLRGPRYWHPYYWAPFVLIGSAD